VRKKKDERLNDYFAKIWSFIVDFINNTRVDPTTYRDIIKAATSHLRLELLPIIYPRQLAPSQGPQPKKSAQITAPYPRQPTPPSLKEQKHEPTSTITPRFPIKRSSCASSQLAVELTQLVTLRARTIDILIFKVTGKRLGI
jgi:hypothetical protein